MCMRRRPSGLIALCVAALLSFSGNRRYITPPSPSTIAVRAFVITDPEIPPSFSLERVFTSLGSGQPVAWLNTLIANQTAVAPRPAVTPLAGFIPTTENGFWRPAGADRWSHIRPIAIVNRFDLAPADYRNCGEYRLIFTRQASDRARLHIAIEMVLQNPHPRRGKAGCASVAAFWWELAGNMSNEARRDRLEKFFFEGLPSFPPALDPQAFERFGRIRTSEIVDGRPRFAQFELKRHCAPGQPCAPRLTRVPLDNMPDAGLFDGNDLGERAASFRRDFLRQVASLSIPDVNRYFMSLDRAYSVSDVGELIPTFNYAVPFRRAQHTVVGRQFREQIAEELRKAGSPLTPENIIDRAETQNCSGCHGKSGPVGGGVVFPNAFDEGVHIADESLANSVRFSPALEEVFLPYRIDVLRQFLRTTSEARFESSLHSMP